jgi:hypothetical protein
MADQFKSDDSTKPTSVYVKYYSISPKGSRTLFEREFSLMNLRYAQSETAVLGYLQDIHPDAKIQIQKLEFR